MWSEEGEMNRAKDSTACNPLPCAPPNFSALFPLLKKLYLAQSWCSGRQTGPSWRGPPGRWRRGTCTWSPPRSPRSSPTGLCWSTWPTKCYWHVLSSWWPSWTGHILYVELWSEGRSHLSSITFSSAAVTCNREWMRASGCKKGKLERQIWPPGVKEWK